MEYFEYTYARDALDDDSTDFDRREVRELYARYVEKLASASASASASDDHHRTELQRVPTGVGVVARTEHVQLRSDSSEVADDPRGVREELDRVAQAEHAVDIHLAAGEVAADETLAVVVGDHQPVAPALVQPRTVADEDVGQVVPSVGRVDARRLRGEPGVDVVQPGVVELVDDLRACEALGVDA
eukprot:466198-Prorocentrum_minimum.AAC.4